MKTVQENFKQESKRRIIYETKSRFKFNSLPKHFEVNDPPTHSEWTYDERQKGGGVAGSATRSQRGTSKADEASSFSRSFFFGARGEKKQKNAGCGHWRGKGLRQDLGFQGHGGRRSRRWIFCVVWWWVRDAFGRQDNKYRLDKRILNPVFFSFFNLIVISSSLSTKLVVALARKRNEDGLHTCKRTNQHLAVLNSCLLCARIK